MEGASSADGLQRSLRGPPGSVSAAARPMAFPASSPSVSRPKRAQEDRRQRAGGARSLSASQITAGSYLHPPLTRLSIWTRVASGTPWICCWWPFADTSCLGGTRSPGEMGIFPEKRWRRKRQRMQ